MYSLLTGVLEGAGPTLLAETETAQSAELALKQAGESGAATDVDNTGKLTTMETHPAGIDCFNAVQS